MPRIARTPAGPVVSINVPQAQEPAPSQQGVQEKQEKEPFWFWQELAEIPADKWGRNYDVVLFRTDPKVPGQPGSKGYLTIFMDQPTLERIKATYGGGKYQACLRKDGRFVTSHAFEVEGKPVYDFTVERPGPAAGGNGAALEQLIAILRDELKQLREAGQESPMGAGSLKLLETAANHAMEMIKSQVPQASNPAEQLRATILTLKELGLLGQEKSGVMETINTLKTLGLIGQTDPVQQLTTFMALFEKLDSLRGETAGGRPRDWKATLAEKAVEQIPQLIHEIREAREAGNRLAGMQRFPAPPRPPIPAAANPAATAAPAAPLPTHSGLHTVPLSAASPAAPQSDDDALTNWVMQRMVELLYEGEEPEAIVDFVDLAKPGMSNDLVAYEPEQLTALFSRHPILHRAVSYPKWNEFLLRARKYILSDEPEPETEPRPN